MPCSTNILLVQALASCHKLKTINFTWCIQLTDDGVCPIASGCTSLTSLSLHGLRGITNRTIEALAQHNKESLQTLDVHGCIGISTKSNDTEAYLLELLPNIEEFVVHT